MSQPPPVPPDPADAVSAAPDLPPPIPAPVRVVAQPYSYPLSVLPYTVPAGNARPGLVTAIAIASIIVGSLGMLSGGFMALMWLGFFSATSAAAWNTGSAFATEGPNGYDASDRRVIVQAMNLKQRMTSAQREQLQFFLSDVGQTYVTGVPIASPTNDPVADWAAANLTSAGPALEGGAEFAVPMGKLHVTDTAAAITLADGATITRSTIRQMPNPSDPTVLSPQEVGALVNRIQEMTYGSPLNAAQTTSLAQTIQANSSGLLIAPPKDMPTLLAQVQSVGSNAGNAYVVFPGGTVSVSTTGTSVFTAMATAPVGPGGGKIVGNTQARQAILTLLVESLLSAGLSIYLLVIGIFTLRNSPAGATLHKVYAWLKVMLSVVAAAAVGWLIRSSGGTDAWAWLGALAMLLVALIYPVVVLLVLPAKSVREWYTVEPAK